MGRVNAYCASLSLGGYSGLSDAFEAGAVRKAVARHQGSVSGCQLTGKLGIHQLTIGSCRGPVMRLRICELGLAI